MTGGINQTWRTPSVTVDASSSAFFQSSSIAFSQKYFAILQRSFIIFSDDRHSFATIMTSDNHHTSVSEFVLLPLAIRQRPITISDLF